MLLLLRDVDHVEPGLNVLPCVRVEVLRVLVPSNDDVRLLELSGAASFHWVLVVTITHLVECSGFDVGGGELVYEYKLRVSVHFLVDF